MDLIVAIILWLYQYTGLSLAVYTFSEEQRLTYTPSASRDPSVAVNGETIHVVWIDYEDVSDSEIYYLKSVNGGVTWGSSSRITDNDDADMSPYLVASNQHIYLAYSGIRPSSGDRSDIFFRYSRDNGQTWSEETNVSNS
ncbi:exo-alpha-sialidase [bacterium]|nr:exo-alpha-sialidase [candidate division CSSED10-310 bacterium]